MRPNANTTALIAALRCTIAPLKRAALRAVREAISKADTLQGAALALGISNSALRRFRRIAKSQDR